MKPIKKPELRILKKSNPPQQPPEQPPQQPQQPTPQVEPEPIDTPVAESQQTQNEPLPEYYSHPAPAPDHPLAGSVGNSGWQVSDIWRDLRVDGFCD